MSARIPHMLTHLLSSDELDAVEQQFREKSAAAATASRVAEELTWLAAVDLLAAARREAFKRRADQPPSARRKSLGLRLTR
jgi:hypothetical protein